MTTCLIEKVPVFRSDDIITATRLLFLFPDEREIFPCPKLDDITPEVQCDYVYRARGLVLNMMKQE